MSTDINSEFNACMFRDRYDRHDYLPEMRLALQRWADHLDRLVSGQPAGNVVAFR